MEFIKIPHERIAILIGERGKTKKQIEKVCEVTLNVDEDGEVEVDGDTAHTYFAKDVVKAIGRGFAVKQALKITTDNFAFYLIDLDEYARSDKDITRIKGRVIGEKGKVKKEIESATESYLSVYGDTIGIISKIDTMEYAKEAVSMLIDGSQHSRVFNYLAKIRRQIMGERLR